MGIISDITLMIVSVAVGFILGVETVLKINEDYVKKTTRKSNRAEPEGEVKDG